MAGLHTDNPNPADAVRWLGPIDVAGQTREALFCHPTSRVEYSVAVRPGDRVTGFVSLLPDVWQKNVGGVEFSTTVTTVDSRQTGHAIRVDPGRRSADRRWRRFALPVRVDREQEVTITLSTAVPAGERPDHAWAIWGDPAIEHPLPLAEILRTLRARVSRARGAGLGAIWREWASESQTDDAVSRYRAWFEPRILTPDALTKMRDDAERLPYRPVISVITPVYNTDPRWLIACIDSVGRQAYPHWQLCLCDDASTSTETRAVLDAQSDPRIHVVRLDRNSHISAASNGALRAATGEFIALLDHDDELTPDALFEAAVHLNRAPDTDVVYSDEDKLDPDGGHSDPFFKPDWSPEHLLSAMYTSHLTVARRTLVDRVGGFRVGYEGSQDHDLALRLSDVTRQFHHIPRILYHWRRAPGSTATSGGEKPWAQDAGARALQDWLRRRGLQGAVESGGVPGLYRVRFAICDEPLVSVIIVSPDRNTEAARACADRVRELTGYAQVETIGADEPIACTTADVNAAVRRSAGSHIVCVDARLEPINDEWLTAMLEYSQQDAIGAVGAKILYADGRLRHIGLLLGVAPGVARAMHRHPGSSYGYFSSAIGVRNYSAVSGECLMTRRALFDQIGGFDERLPWSVADVDYCLKAAGTGRRSVFTSYAQLRQRSSSSADDPTPATDAIAMLRTIWRDRIDRDPYYNTNLSRLSTDYELMPTPDSTIPAVPEPEDTGLPPLRNAFS